MKYVINHIGSDGKTLIGGFQMSNAFCSWLNTFVAEKDLDLDHTFEVEGDGGLNLIPLGAVIETMQAWPTDLQSQTKGKLVSIDLLNGDVVPFFKGIAGVMALNKYTASSGYSIAYPEI
jgi:hypothetical protein|tara:strand:+ start:955 stop:1311 length:357 start_codon:yes stop_codon:yes gene_type:complete